MSLLEEAFKDFTVINKAVVDDGYGGTKTTWTDGATIRGAIVIDTSAQMKTAQALGSAIAYTFTVSRDTELDYHTVIRRNSDSKIFRLTSDTDDKETPASAGLNMRQYTAEEFVLPS